MKKQLSLICLSVGLLFCTAGFSNWMQDFIDVVSMMDGIQAEILKKIAGAQAALNDIDGLMKQVEESLKGHSGWGTYNSHDYQSYGKDAATWNSVLQMSAYGRGSGPLGETLNGLSNQFPLEVENYNRGIGSSNNQKYYALKSQTVLATRAASELDYNKIQDQIAYQQMLQQQIEKTQDLKAATDLLNRIQVEGNLINLEILRQVALSNQQQAVSEQANVNAALATAKFLTKTSSGGPS